MGEKIETLEEHKEFFVNYKRTFLKNFIIICSELNPDVTSNDKVKVIIGNLYDRFFPLNIKEKDDSDIDSELCSIGEKVIALKLALSENFFLMIKDFINYLLPKENEIIHLKSLINIVGGHINALDRIGYNDRKQIGKKDIVVEKDREREEKEEEEKEDIFKKFELIEKEGKEVKFINFYKGVLIRYDAYISNMIKDWIIFNVHKYQAVAMEAEKQTIIKSEIFPKMIKASVVTVNLKALKASLTNFAYISEPPEKRMFMRVKPKDPIEVVIQNNYKITGTLVDISIAAMAVYVIEPIKFQQKEVVTVHAKIPNVSQNTFMEINVTGEIISIYSINIYRETGLYKLVIEIHPDPYSEPLIAQYIYQRQAEILRELNLVVIDL